MAQNHVQDISTLGSIESSLRQAVQLGILANADLATNQATTLANMATRNANLRPDLQAQYQAAIAAVKLCFNMLGNTTTIAGLTAIYAAIEADWQLGFAVAL